MAAELARLTRQLARERSARLEAEAIAELATRDLYDKQQGLVLLQAMVMAANEATQIEDAMGTALRRICSFSGWSIGHLYLCAEEGGGELRSTPIWYFKDPQR